MAARSGSRPTACWVTPSSTRSTTWTECCSSTGLARTSFVGLCPRRCRSAPDTGQESAVNIHEYQAREILARYGIPTTRGGLATSPEEARQMAEQLGGRVVVKAQVLVGGRGT